MGKYIVNVKFDRDNIKHYICHDMNSAEKVVYAAKKFNLDYEVLLELDGYQEVINLD